MSHHKQFQVLFVGQSQKVATNLQMLVQKHAPAIFPSKNSGAFAIELKIATSQRTAWQIVRGNTLAVVLLETGYANGNRQKFANTIRQRQPLTRLIEVGREQTTLPHPFDSFLRIPVEPQSLIEVLKRCLRPNTAHLIPFKAFVLDTANDLLIRPEGESQLRPMEAKLLRYLLENRNVIVKRADIMRKVWGTEYLDDTRTLDVHIRHLRERIEKNPSAPQLLVTERGLGYVLHV